VPSPEEVVEDANALTGRAWRVVAPMAGGYQNGAHLIEDDDGQYILKWSPRVDWAERVAKTASYVAIARAAGYPTPAWLAHGVTRGGLPFHVQELVEGDSADLGDANLVDEIFRITALQRELCFEEATDWTWYVTDVAFNNHGGHQTDLLAAGEATADAVRCAVDLAGEPGAPLVRHEMVHGDFSIDNMVVRDGRVVALVDIEAVGTGCASFDLLAPARQDYIWGERRVAGRLMEEAIRRDGPAYFGIAVAAHVINILAFGLDHWSIDDVQGAAVAALTWIEDCRTLLA
jgi:aminoglycoside phosphotransferase (APT) family kinase protein